MPDRKPLPDEDAARPAPAARPDARALLAADRALLIDPAGRVEDLYGSGGLPRRGSA